MRYQVSDRYRSAPRIRSSRPRDELVGGSCGAEVAGRQRDLAPVDREQRGPQQGKQIVTERGGGVELPDLLELAEERRDREPLRRRLDERLTPFDGLVVPAECDRRLAGRHLGPRVPHGGRVDGPQDVLSQRGGLRRSRRELDAVACGAGQEGNGVDPVPGVDVRVLQVRGQVGLERPAQEAPPSVRLGARQEHLLVAAADAAPGFDTVASRRRLVGRQLGVEAQGDGQVAAVHQGLRVVPTDGGGVGPVRQGGVGDELELLVPPGLPEDQEDLADAVGQGRKV